MTYTSKDIRVLSELDHIRLNPGVYISSIETPTHLIEEALDNSLDEAFMNECSIIVVCIDSKRKIYNVLDNGRGIPIENDIPKLICSKLFSGSKFKDKKTAYKISTGLNGIGLVAVNALSSSMKLEIYRDKKHVTYNFEKGVFISSDQEDFKGQSPFSTSILFDPDPKIFKSLDVDKDRIKKRLDIASISLPNITLALVVDSKKDIIKIDEDTFFANYCLTKQDKNISDVIKIECRNKLQQLSIKFCYSFDGPTTQKIMSSVNLLPVDNGGTHILYLYTVLKDTFSAFCKKAGRNFYPQDALIGLRAFVNLIIEKPEFSGAAKEKITNSKEDLFLFEQFKIQLNKYLLDNPEILNNLLDFFDSYRKKLVSKKLVRTSTKRASIKLTKLRDCSDIAGELFLCEGDSAAGTLIDCRDPKKHAIMPLKGKIPSVVTKKDILNNKEISEIIDALGTGLGDYFDICKLRYDKIIITTDSDPDGWHISCLLIMAFAILVPNIVKEEKLYVCKTPLYGLVKGKQFTPLWKNEDVRKAREDNQQVTRFKGIGEFSPWQLKSCVIDTETRQIVKILYSKHLNKLIDLFSGSEHKRKLLNGEIYYG